MKTPRLLFLVPILALIGPALAQDVPGILDAPAIEDIVRGIRPKKADAVKLEAKRIVNESNSFLKEREPEMTAEEYALYEKVVTMLSTNVDFALTMLEGMMDEKEKPSPAFEFILGNTYYTANRPEEAEKRYRNAIARYPDFLRAWNNLGVLYYTGGRYAEAAPCFSKSIALGDRDPMTFGLLGFCLEQEGDLSTAEMAYLQARTGDPTNSDWMDGLLRIYIDGKQYGRAEPLARKLVRDRPAESHHWQTYAMVLLAEGRKVEATVLLETAATTGLAGPDELLLLGDLYADQQLAEEAVAVYQKARVPARDQGEQRLVRLAQTLIATGKLAEAEQTLGALGTNLTPPGRLAWLQARADLWVAHQRWPEARAEAEALLRLAPLDGAALLTLGRTHTEEGDFARATLAFEAAHQIPASAYRASLELAGIELRNRRYAKSVQYLENALSIRKSDTVSDYLARVRMLAEREANSD